MKKKTSRLTLIIGFIIAISIVAACSTTPAEPTLDANMIYTEAAKTVAAQLTAEVTPTEEPTITPIPTNTEMPTATDIPERPTATEAPEESNEAAEPTIQPTATTASNANELIDQALFTVFFPPDDQVYTSGGTFNPQVGFQNTGPNTWNNQYSMRYISGSTLGVEGKYTIELYGNNSSVAPGEEVLITLPKMTAPQEEGRYTSNWCFYNNREDQGLAPQCFYLVTFQIIVQN